MAGAVRSMSVEMELKVAGRTLWEASKSTELIPKLIPDYVAACDYVEGDGGPGSIRLMKFGPAVANFVTFSKERIEVLDDIGKKIVYSVIDGELMHYFKMYKVSLNVLEGANNDSCVVNWVLEYESIDLELPPPEMAKEGVVNTFKALEAHLLQIHNVDAN